MNRTPFWLKALLAVVLTAGLGALAALAAVKAIFPEPKLRAWAVSTARKQLGRDVRLDRIAVGLSGVTLTGLEVSEKPDFSAGTFLRVRGFRLRPSWSAALRRRVVVSAVSAEGLSVRLVKGKDGRFNFETLASSSAAAAPSPAPAKTEEGAPELDVRRASISDGKVEYADESSGQSWTASGVDLDVRGFGSAAPFDVSGSLRLTGKAGARPVDAKLALDATVDLAKGRRDAFKADVRRASVEAEWVKVVASGKVAGLDAPKTTFSAVVSAAGKTVLTADGTAALGPAVDVNVKARTPGLDTALIAALAPQAGIPSLKLPAADLAVDGSFASGRADVRAFSASWAGGKVEGAGSARGLGGAKPVYEGRAKVAADVPEIKPGEYPFLNLPPKLFIPAARLEGELSYAGDELTLPPLTAKLKLGNVSLSGIVRRLSTGKPVPDVTIALALDLPAFKASDLPFTVSALPPSLTVPPLRLDGGVRVSGDDVTLEKMVVKGKSGSVRLDGPIAKALAGDPRPDLSVAADLSLPELTDKDLPFAGVPAGLQMPPSQWSTEFSYSPKLVRVKTLRVKTGKNDLDVSGTVTDPGGRGAFDLLLKCRSFALDELTRLTPQTRDLKLAGGGFFALSMTGVKDHPLFAGKLQFKGVGATVADLALADFTGTASFDERRIDLPNLTGRLADGTLKADLTVRDYSRAPEIQLDADLDRFDLGKWMSAKGKVEADKAAAAAAKPPSSGASQEKPAPVATRGHLSVGTLVDPYATVTDVKAAWDLRGVNSDKQAALNGGAEVHIGGGRIVDLGKLFVQSKLAKTLFFPVMMVQKFRGADLDNMTLNQFAGDYGFVNGLMTFKRSEIDTSALNVNTSGTIDLPSERLDLLSTVQYGNVVGVEVTTTGTFDHPNTKAHVGKALAEGAKNLLLNIIQKPQ